MYYIAKFLQAGGLAIILVGFLIRFPHLMDTKLLGLGGMIFFGGWLLQNVGLKK
jgi:hypothetical protein